MPAASAIHTTPPLLLFFFSTSAVKLVGRAVSGGVDGGGSTKGSSAGCWYGGGGGRARASGGPPNGTAVPEGLGVSSRAKSIGAVGTAEGSRIVGRASRSAPPSPAVRAARLMSPEFSFFSSPDSAVGTGLSASFATSWKLIRSLTLNSWLKARPRFSRSGWRSLALDGHGGKGRRQKILVRDACRFPVLPLRHDATLKGVILAPGLSSALFKVSVRPPGSTLNAASWPTPPQ